MQGLREDLLTLTQLRVAVPAVVVAHVDSCPQLEGTVARGQNERVSPRPGGSQAHARLTMGGRLHGGDAAEVVEVAAYLGQDGAQIRRA